MMTLIGMQTWQSWQSMTGGNTQQTTHMAMVFNTNPSTIMFLTQLTVTEKQFYLKPYPE